MLTIFVFPFVGRNLKAIKGSVYVSDYVTATANLQICDRSTPPKKHKSGTITDAAFSCYIVL